MTPDPKLVEAVARAIARCEYGSDAEFEAEWGDGQGAWQYWNRREATAALAAISASGEWWIAPASLTGAMVDALGNGSFADNYERVRNAHLKDTGTDK